VVPDYDFDLFTIGAGSGGVAASRRSGAFGARVATEEGAPLAPAAAAGEHAVVAFADEVGAVLNELRVDAEGATQRPLDLLRRVVGAAEGAR